MATHSVKHATSRKLQRKKIFSEAMQNESVPLLSQKPALACHKGESITHLPCDHSTMAPRRMVEVKSGDHNSQKWRISLNEDVFESFMAHCGDAARKVFGEGSLFSPLLFGKFFDPADAFPLWEFDSDDLLSGLQGASKRTVDWRETEAEYVLKAELPGVSKCEVEICSEKGKVLEITGQWRGRESNTRDWRMGHWWEHGYVRRIELPENVNCRRIETCIDDDGYLEIKIPKHISDCSASQTNAAEDKESEFV